MTSKFLALVLLSLVVVLLLLLVGCGSIERKLLYFPTHRPGDGGMQPWMVAGERIGVSRVVESPENVWLMLHGNGGQAADRNYALPCLSNDDSVYVMEYPGYGPREGVPSKDSFNQAAGKAFQWLRAEFPDTPVCVIGESIGTGPSSYLGSLSDSPDKIVLVTPFERLSLVAKERFPGWLVSMALKSDWDNAASLSGYDGPVAIFGAKEDRIIPVSHARSLAAKVRGSNFHMIEGGHNEWSLGGKVAIRNP